MSIKSSAPAVNIHARNLDLDVVWLEHVETRVNQLDRFGNSIIAIDVEVTHNRNPRRQAKGWHVEIQTRVDGHVILAKAEAADPERAFELARQKMEANLRRAARRHHWSRHGRKSTMRMTEVLA